MPSADKNGTSSKCRRSDLHWPQRSVNTGQSQCSTSRQDAGAPSSWSRRRRYNPGYARWNLLTKEDGGVYGTNVGLATTHGTPSASAMCHPSKANKLITTNALFSSLPRSNEPLSSPGDTEQFKTLSRAQIHSCVVLKGIGPQFMSWMLGWELGTLLRF